MSPDTFDEYVRKGVLPEPKRLSDIERWKWSEIALAMPQPELRLGHACRRSASGCVYVLECDGFAKIGFTTALRRRISALQLCNPKPLRFLVALCGDRRLERSLHQRFAEHHTSGEWFRLSGTLAEFLRSKGCDV